MAVCSYLQVETSVDIYNLFVGYFRYDKYSCKWKKVYCFTVCSVDQLVYNTEQKLRAFHV